MTQFIDLLILGFFLDRLSIIKPKSIITKTHSNNKRYSTKYLQYINKNKVHVYISAYI